MIEKLLKELGFGEKEIDVYLTVLEQGKITPANVSNITNIKRPTVYSIAKELIDKGVLVEDVGSTKGYLVALPPEDLKNIIKREERELQNKKGLIEQTIKELQNFTKDTKYSIPKIKFIYKEDLEDFLYKQAPEWNRSIMETDGVWWGYQDPSFVKDYQKWIDWFWKDCASEKLVLKLLTNESKVEKEMAKRGYDRRLVKFWNNGKNFTATTWVNGDYLILVVTNQKPYYLVQIHDATLAHNMREMFRGIWESIK